MGIQFECYSDDRGRRAYSLMQPFFHHLRGGGAGVISPSDISGLAAWHRADLGVTTSASKVTSWLDQSGNGNTASNGASLGPTVTSANATFNNKATLNFAQSGTKYLQWVSQAFVGMSTGAHAFFVFNVAADPPATTAHTGFCNLGDSSDALQGTYMTFTDGVIYDDMFRSAAIGFRTVGNPTPSLTAASLYEVISTSSEWTAKVNGTQLYTTATNTFADRTSGKLLGVDGTSTRFMDGSVAEIIFYNAKLSTANRSALVEYINDRYATTYV